MIAPAAPPTAAPMIAPRAVDPVAFPTTAPATAPPAAPMTAPCSFFVFKLAQAFATSIANGANVNVARAEGVASSAYFTQWQKTMGGRLLLVPGVHAIVRNTNGEILITRRSDDGQWDLPGGAVDPGEVPAESVRREVKEETGLEVRV